MNNYIFFVSHLIGEVVVIILDYDGGSALSREKISKCRKFEELIISAEDPKMSSIKMVSWVTLSPA